MLFYKFIHFNWMLITLQYYSGFAMHCHKSATGVHVFPILNPLPPPSPSYPPGSSQGTSPEHPVSCIKPRLAICFTYDNKHVSMLFSQIIPPWLSLIQGYHYHLSKFHIYALVYCIGVLLSGSLHSV